MFEQLTGMIGGITDLSLLAILVIFVVFAFIAYKVIHLLVKCAIILVVSAAFPFVLAYFGIPLPASIQAMGTFEKVIWFAFGGLSLFLMYHSISTSEKIIKIITWPFKFLFRGRAKDNQKKQEPPPQQSS
jgi:hypothetical protein